MYYVYILASRRHGTLYIGVTNSLQKRLAEHRSGEGSSFVKTYSVYRLVYVESYDRPGRSDQPGEATEAVEAGLEDRAD
jgi:putative endonuclease